MPENNYQQGSGLPINSNFEDEKNIKTRKAAVVILAVLGVFFIVLGIGQMKNRITSPFVVSNEITTDQDQLEANYLSVLQSRDTDGDKLFDYDEINIYGTSAYLEDTDSDGISDYDEISNGTDPTCPKGQNCNGIEVVDDNTNTVEQNNEITVAPITNNNLTDEDAVILEGVINGEADTETLRALLLANGFTNEDLDQIGDDELNQIYLQVLEDQANEQSDIINNQ